MNEGIRKEIAGMSLSELNNLMDYIRDVQVITAKASLKIGQKVYVVQKTKRTKRIILKIKQRKCTVDIGGRIYSVPMSMLEAA